MLPQKLAFIDIETTGMRSFYDRIIEVGIIRVEDNIVTKTYHSLVNPQAHIPSEIEMMTGITAKDLENAPTFRQIKEEILETLVDSIFVAHNVRFDYSFIKNEFARENISYTSKHFCTVRLSRLLYPKYRHHNLDALIERHGFSCGNRHRALEDATVIYNFYQKIQKEFTSEKVLEVLAKCLKKPSLPIKLTSKHIDSLPEKPGVYIFYGADEQNKNVMPLYIGKSKNIKERVLSHFSGDIHSPTEMKITQQIESIETITTAGELGALLLESQLIKKMLPLYNKKSRIKKELISLRKLTDKNGYSTVQLEVFHANSNFQNLNIDTILGIFKSRKQAKAFLANIAKEYSLCEKLLGLEKTLSACFAYRLERCKGACVNMENPLAYNMRFTQAFTATKLIPWPFTSPIRIEETGSDGNKEYFLIDNWCFLGSVAFDRDGNRKTSEIKDAVFDLDVYNILKQYIKNIQNTKKIRSLKKKN